MLIEQKLKKYHQLKRIKTQLEKQIAQLNAEIKDELGPGDHQIGDYKANITFKRKFNLDADRASQILDRGLYSKCLRLQVDPEAVESAYLAGLIDDTQLVQLRGQAQITTALEVSRVQANV